MKAIFGITATLLVIPCCLFCQIVGVPIPNRWLHGGQIVVPEFNFSINSPNPDSQWSYSTNLPKVDGSVVTAFFADAGTDKRYSLMILERSGRMNPAGAREFIAGVQNS